MIIITCKCSILTRIIEKSSLQINWKPLIQIVWLCKWIYERLYTGNYLNCGERYEFMINHHNYIHNLSNCEIKAWRHESICPYLWNCGYVVINLFIPKETPCILCIFYHVLVGYHYVYRNVDSSNKRDLADCRAFERVSLCECAPIKPRASPNIATV